MLLHICIGEIIANSNEKCVSGQLFVKVADGSPVNLILVPPLKEFSPELEQIIIKYGISNISMPFILDDEKLQKTYLVQFDTNTVADDLIKEFQQLVFVEYAERVPLYECSLTPNDLHPNQWYLPQIQAEAAWDITTGSASVVIAIVDDAVLLSHEDLAPVIWVNPGEIPGNGIDDEPNGYIDDINGWDAADNDNDPNPVNPTNSYFTHGTHCAGLAAAATDNNVGIASVSYNVKLMAVKTAFTGWGSVPAAYLGVQYAMAANADIISMSWGGTGFSQTYQNIFNTAHNQGIVLIAAAGNDNTDILAYPASYNHIISVGATNSSDQKAWFSNYGDSIDVMAPGQAIWSTLAGSNSSYDYLNGTSMACPLVSSLAALMLSWDPTLTPDELEACLKSSCDNIDAQNPSYIGQIGAGRINAEQALLCLKPINADFTSDYTLVCPGDTVQFTDLSSNNPTSWFWSFPGGFPVTSTLQNPSVIYSTPGVYDVYLSVTNANGTDTVTKSSYIIVALPTATISGSATIPAGFSANLKVVLTGNPNWSITYFDGTSNTTINNITNSPYYITVSPNVTTTYTLVSVSDNGCAGTVLGDATITVVGIGNTVCLTLQPDSIVGKDANVFSLPTAVNTNYANHPKTYIMSWTYSSVPGDHRSFIEFDLSSIPNGSAIISASLTLTSDSTGTFPYGHSTLSGSNDSYCRRITQAWDETTITWNNQPNSTTLNQATLPASTAIDEDYNINVTALVQDMINDPANSHGFMFQLVTEAYYRSLIFASSDNADAWRWPKLEICYATSTTCISLQPNAAVGKDVMLHGLATQVNNNFGNQPDLLASAWTFSGTPGDLRSLIDFDLSFIPNGAAIVSADLSLFFNPTSSNAGHSTLSGSNECYLRRVTSTWDEMTVTWNTQPTTTTGNEVTLAASISNTQDYPNIDVTALVQDMVNNPSTSFGFMFRLVTESFYRAMLFASSDNADSTKWPKLEICYVTGSTPDPCPSILNEQKISDTLGNFTGTLLNDDRFGQGVAGIGDFNGDGIPDLVVGAAGDDDGGIDKGAIWLLLMNTDGTVNSYQKISDTQGNFTGAIQDTWGNAIAAIGDLNNDGVTDLVVGEPRATDGSARNGAVWILFLDSNGTVQSHQKISQTQGNFNITMGADFRFGIRVAYLGDLDGDNIGDIAVGVIGDNDGGTKRGAVWILFLDTDGTVKSKQKISSTAGNFLGTLDDFDRFGASICTIGDINFDGVVDIAVGSRTDDDGGTDRGAVWILLLNSDGTVLSHSKISSTQGGFTGSIADGVQFGIALSNLGDLDNNGVDDILVGSHGDDDGGTDRGAAWILYLNGDASVKSYFKISSTQGGFAGPLDDGDIMGWAVSLVGDLDNDGNVEIALGAARDDDGGLDRGAVWIISIEDTCLIIPDTLSCAITADFSADTVCLGDSTSFTDLSSDSIANIVFWKWYFGDGDSIIGVQNPIHLYSTADTFSVILIIGNDSAPACFDTVIKQVLVLDTLLIKAPPDNSICTGDSIQLAPLTMICGAAPFTYNWTPGGSLSDPTIANPNAGPQSQTTYYITVTDAAGMTSTDSVTIYIDTGCCRSWALIGSDTNYCFGDTVNFSNNSIANGSATYTWFFGAFATPASFVGASPPPVYFNTTGTVQIILILSDSCGVDTGYHNVNIFPAPMAEAGADTTLCRFDTVQIGSIPISSHSYAWNPTIGLSDSIIANPYAYADSSLTYVVVITNMVSGCTNSDSITITRYPATIANAGIDTSHCAGDSLQLNATGGIIYSWTPSTGLSDDSIANPWVIVIDTTTYFVTVTDSNSCSAMDSVTIRVNPLPNAYAGADTSYCEGDSVQLMASGGVSYVWTPGSGLSDASIADPWVDTSNTTIYVVTVSDSNNCVGMDSVTVSVNALPVVDAGSDTSICSGNSVQLFASGGIIFAWTPANDLSDDSIQNPIASPLDTTKYFVTVVDSLGCSNMDSVVISVVPLPIITATADTVICSGDVISVFATSNGAYSWSTGDTTQSIIVSPTSDSLYIVSTNNMCGTVSDSIWVLVNPSSFADAGLDVTIILGNSTQLLGMPSGSGLSYLWTPALGLSCTNCQFPLATPENTTTYYLTVTDSLGCTAIDTVIITVDKTMVIFIPDIFSPNADGENDYFYVQGLGIEELKMVIFDRWGEKVFENTGFIANDKYVGWDGMFKGKLMNAAVFVYMVTGTFIDGTEINEKGDFTLVK